MAIGSVHRRIIPWMVLVLAFLGMSHANLSTNSLLSALGVNVGTLTPTFENTTLTYTVNGLGVADTSLTITASAYNPNATIILEINQVLQSGVASPALYIPSTATEWNVDVYTVGNASSTKYKLTTSRPQSSSTAVTSIAFASGLLQPAFSPSVYSYTVDVVYEDSQIQTAVVPAHPGTIVTLDSSSTMAHNTNISLAVPVGERVVNISTTAEDGTVGSSYIFTIKRHSGNSSLESLTLSTGVLVPSFNPTTTAYTATVANAVATLSLTPTLKNTGATCHVQGSLVASGSPSPSTPLSVGVNIFTVKVTESNVISVTEYGLTVTREPFQSQTDTTLYSLALSPGTLTPAFSKGITDYSVSLPNNIASVTITAVVNSPGAKIALSGINFAPGQRDLTLFVKEGDTDYFLVITAPDGTTRGVTRVAVSRAPGVLPPYINVMDITDNSVPVVMVPAFNPQVLEYDVNVGLQTSSVLIKVTLPSGVTATLGGDALTDAGSTVSIKVGQTLVEIVTQNTDGLSYTYKIKFLRGSGEAKLQSLTISPGSLNPSFTASTLTYSVQDRKAWGVITATASQTNATVTFLSPGSGSGSTTHSQNVTLGSAKTSMKISVQSPNMENTQVYELELPVVVAEKVTAIQTVNAAKSTLKSLVVRDTILDPAFQPAPNGTASLINTAIHRIVIPFEQDSIEIIAVPDDSAATMQIDGQSISAGISSRELIPPTGSVIRVVVAAVDGSSISEYQLQVTRLPKIDATFTSFSPARGLDRGGTQITITGNNLELVKKPLQCQFGTGALLDATVDIPTDSGFGSNANPTIRCETPPSSFRGPVAVKVYSASELIWAFSTYFLYFNPRFPSCTDSALPFLCGDGTCVQKLTECPKPNCPSSAAVQCWDGACAASILQCAPIPSCPKNIPKLCDGICIGADVKCLAEVPDCGSKNLCVDGTCKDVCAPTFQCPPDTPVRCADGSCKISLEECNEGCPAGQSRCIDETCVDDPASCVTPPALVYPLPKNVGWDVSLNAVVLVIYNAEDPDEYLAWITVPVNALEDSTGNTGMFLSVEPYPDSLLRSVKKPDNWESLEKGIFSTVLQVTIPNNVTRPFNVPIQFKFKQTLPHPAEELCFAYINETSKEFVCTEQKISPIRGSYFTEIDHLTPVAIIMRPDPALVITISLTWQLYVIILVMVPFLAGAWWYGRKRERAERKAFMREQFDLYGLYLPPLADDDPRQRFSIVLNEKMPNDLRLELSQMGLHPRFASMKAMPSTMRYYDIFVDPFSDSGMQFLSRLSELGLIKFLHPGDLRPPKPDEEEAIPWNRSGGLRLAATVSQPTFADTQPAREEGDVRLDEDFDEVTRALGIDDNQGGISESEYEYATESDDNDDDDGSNNSDDDSDNDGKVKPAKSRKKRKKKTRAQLLIEEAEESLTLLGLHKVSLRPEDEAAGAVSRWEALLEGDIGEEAKESLVHDISVLNLVNLIDSGTMAGGSGDPASKEAHV
eukprot:TRINITY_DN1819_c0_g1_i1.p1 TRINITY_DN1819_c0_g1~~TRINITY_DN1819_c0_g1_i1.p1  ORF type:complete len:1487 (-),score=327.56 TRINITY_DN1819_c0_g1_i1:20-4480(-)